MKKILLFLCAMLMLFLSSCKNDAQKADDLRIENKFEEAFELYEKVAQNGDAYAKWRLAYAYANGDGTDLDYDKAKQLLEEAAKEGCEEAQCDLACSKMYGWLGYEIDVEEGMKTLKTLASKSKNAYVLSRYAKDIYHGWNFEEDEEKAERILNKIENKDNDLYLQLMGEIYENGGEKIERNIPKAIEYYTKSFEQGRKGSAENLGNIYKNGNDDIEKDIKKAIDWYNKGVEGNSTSCMLQLARIYLSEDTLYKDLHSESKAIDMIKKAAKHGDSDAYKWLGKLYQYGEYLPKDDNKAFKYYEKSYKLNSPNGAFFLGFAYIDGIGCEKNVERGIEVWKKGAELGSGAAAYNLYCYYSYGGGFTNDKSVSDKNLAKYYLFKAAKLGDDYGCLALGRKYFTGTEFVEKNERQAFTYIKIAADAGIVDASALVAYMYENAIGCDKDVNEAKKYRDKAKAKEDDEIK